MLRPAFAGQCLKGASGVGAAREDVPVSSEGKGDWGKGILQLAHLVENRNQL